ncbi:MAG: hypothetical protein KA419_13705 [Acidobacteria bacterium]|nr:hypothetical protein [Acidobacteriota bacterium]
MPKKKIDVGCEQKRIGEMTIDEFKVFYQKLLSDKKNTIDDIVRILKEKGADSETIKILELIVPVQYSPSIVKD